MKKFLTVLHLALALLPWLEEAETAFPGDDQGAEKKQFILDAVQAGGSAMMARFGVPVEAIDEFLSLCSDAIDIGVNMCHFSGIFKADKTKLEATYKALALPSPTGPIAIAATDQA